MLTPQEIEHGRALLAKMTPGEWVWIRPPYNAGSGCVRAPGHEAALFYGRSWTSARDNRDDLHGAIWLRNHAAELLADSAALADCEKVRVDTVALFEKSKAALADERAHADRLAEALRGDATVDGEYGVCNACGGTYPCIDPDCAIGGPLAAHAARRKETNDAAR